MIVRNIPIQTMYIEYTGKFKRIILDIKKKAVISKKISVLFVFFCRKEKILKVKAK